MICRHSKAWIFLARKDGMLPPTSSFKASAPRCNSMLTQQRGEKGEEERGKEWGVIMLADQPAHLT